MPSGVVKSKPFLSKSIQSEGSKRAAGSKGRKGKRTATKIVKYNAWEPWWKVTKSASVDVLTISFAAAMSAPCQGATTDCPTQQTEVTQEVLQFGLEIPEKRKAHLRRVTHLRRPDVTYLPHNLFDFAPEEVCGFSNMNMNSGRCVQGNGYYCGFVTGPVSSHCNKDCDLCISVLVAKCQVTEIYAGLKGEKPYVMAPNKFQDKAINTKRRH